MNLDASAFPDIFCAVAAHASHNTRLTLRLLSHWARDAVEECLFEHVEVTHRLVGFEKNLPRLVAARLFEYVEVPHRMAGYESDLLHLERGRHRLPALPIDSRPQWKRTPPELVAPDAEDAAARTTWRRVLQHTHVLETHSHNLHFPPLLHDATSKITLPALRVVRGFRTHSLRSLPTRTYVDVWPTSCVDMNRRPKEVSSALVSVPETSTERHVILVLIDHRDLWELVYLERDQARCRLEFDAREDLHIVIVFRALNVHGNAQPLLYRNIPDPNSTLLYPFLLAVATHKHKRFTIVGLEQVPPRFFGLKANVEVKDLMPDLFFELVHNAWKKVVCSELDFDPEDLAHQVTPENLRDRVRLFSHKQWRDEIGRKDYDRETFGEDVDWNNVIADKECCPWL